MAPGGFSNIGYRDGFNWSSINNDGGSHPHFKAVFEDGVRTVYEWKPYARKYVKVSQDRGEDIKEVIRVPVKNSRDENIRKLFWHRYLATGEPPF